MKGARDETRTHSCKFASLSYFLSRTDDRILYGRADTLISWSLLASLSKIFAGKKKNIFKSWFTLLHLLYAFLQSDPVVYFLLSTECNVSSSRSFRSFFTNVQTCSLIEAVIMSSWAVVNYLSVMFHMFFAANKKWQ